MMMTMLVYIPDKRRLKAEAVSANDFVNIAINEIGNTYYKYTSSLYSINGSYAYAWCSAFVSYCARQAGLSEIKQTAGCEDQYTNSGGNKHYVLNDRSYVPHPGDIVFYHWKNSNSSYDHVEIVEWYDSTNNILHTIAGNSGDGSTTTRRVCRRERFYNGEVKSFITPNFDGIPDPDPDTDTELGIPFPRPTGNPLLKIGSTGQYVGWVQYALKEKLGYDIGKAGVDCDFGDATETAVFNFQNDHDLYPDAIVGPETVQAIVDAIISPPVPPDNSHNPEGFLDSVDGGEGCVTVEGWAYDPDTPNEAVEIHVYMDGGPGKGTGFGGIFADQPSEDVNTIMGYPGNHRFSATIQLDVTGEHTFSAYAINRGLGNDNPKLVNEFTVTIKPKKTIPAPSSCTINVTPTSAFVGDTLQFSASSGYADKYQLYIKKDSGEYKKYEKTGSLLNIVFNEPGTYSAYYLASNEAGSCKSKDITFTIKTINAKFDANGGSCATKSIEVKLGKAYGTLPVPTREGFTFDGWYTSASGGSKITSSSEVYIAGDHTLYAHWTGMDVTITLIDEHNGTTEQIKTQYGKKLPKSEETDLTTGMPLMGWSTSPIGRLEIRNGGIILPVSGYEVGTLTLYALWVAPQISLKVNGQESYEALPGETVHVTLEVEGAQMAYSTIGLKFSYDPSLELSNEKAGEAFKELSPSLTNENKKGIFVVAASGSDNRGKNGIGCYFDIKIPDQAERGTVYPIEFIIDQSFIFSNYEGNSFGNEMEEYASKHCKGCTLKVKELDLGITSISLKNGEQYTITPSEENLTFSSSDTKVAVVSKNGVVTAVGEGSAKISVIASDFEVVQIDVTVSPVVGPQIETPLYGDVNLDGKVTAADATAIMQSIANRDKYELNEQQMLNADVDGVPGVTGKDALVIQQIDAGLYSASDIPLK